MLYELSSLSGLLLELFEIAAGAAAWMADAAAGTVLGHWRTEIGDLGCVLVLRRFDTDEAWRTSGDTTPGPVQRERSARECPEQIDDATSTIALAGPGSLLC